MPAKKQRRPSVFSDPRPVPNSLFGEILDWMLAPLLLVWPVSIAATHHVADAIANQAYDHVLAEQVQRIARELHATSNSVSVTLPPAMTLPAIAQEEPDRQYFQVSLADGELIAGERDLPPLRPADEHVTGKVLFRDGRLAGEPVRIAYLLLPATWDARPILIQAAETRHQRAALSSRIISGVLLPQFAIIPLAVALVWLGLTRGLAPLTRLQTLIRERRPDDFSPIDLTAVPEELRAIVAAFNDMMGRLAENIAAQQRFIAAAAHQLKTPLTGLKTQIELALLEPDGAALRDYLQRIALGVERASHLTRQLLQLARAEASHETAARNKEWLDLGELAREVTMEGVPRALMRNIDIGFEPASQPLKIYGVALLLREMLDNLLDNAIKYTPSGGTVTVRLVAAEAGILEIEDTGIGIPATERAHIFDRFYRVLGTSVEGSGLGLAIVREIAALHGIEISVHTGSQGRGSLFRLILPAATD